MNQYRLFKWDGDNLISLGTKETEDDWEPNREVNFADEDDGDEMQFVVCEVLWAEPRKIKRPNGTTYVPDPIVILKPKE